MMKEEWTLPVTGLICAEYRLPKLVSFLFNIFHCIRVFTNGSSGYRAKTFAPVFGLAFAPRGQVLRREASTFFWIHAASWTWLPRLKAAPNRVLSSRWTRSRSATHVFISC